MPRKYIRKTDKAQWTQQDIEQAIAAVQAGTKIHAASRSFGIPYGTLQTRLRKATNKNVAPRLGRKSVFTPEEEEEMAEHLKTLAKMFYGLTPRELRQAVYQYAESNNIKHNFNRTCQMAGRDWYYSFIARNPTISQRKPEGTSLSRVTAFNKVEVSVFFERLENLMAKWNFEPGKIFNVDETGISSVQQPENILAAKGQKRVGAVTSGERGKTVTIICAMAASGRYIAPMFVFPRQRMSPLLQKDGPADAIYHVSKNGWSNEILFLNWLKHFCKQVKPTLEEPVLLILDNHNSHISIPIYDYCKNNGIIMLSIPPHTSHRLQPLDVTFYGPLKKAFKKECDLFLKMNKFQKITHYDLASLFNKAYSTVATIEKAVSGFSATGIYPIKPNVFGDEDFLPANTSLAHNQSIPTEDPFKGVININVDSPRLSPLPNTDPTLPTSSKMSDDSEKKQHISISFQDVSPIPTPSTSGNKISTRKQHSEILTATPMKAILIAKEEKKAKRRSKTTLKIEKKKTCSKKKKIEKNESTDSSEEDYDESQIVDDDSLDDMDDDGDIKCLVCEDYGKTETWYRCRNCGRWAHRECTGVDLPENYWCDFCSSPKPKSRRLKF